MINATHPSKQKDKTFKRHSWPRSASNGTQNGLLLVLCLLALPLILIGLVSAHATVIEVSIILVYVLLALALVVIPLAALYLLWCKWFKDATSREQVRIEVRAKLQRVRQDEEKHNAMLRYFLSLHPIENE